jgi:hypothetical protein
MTLPKRRRAPVHLHRAPRSGLTRTLEVVVVACTRRSIMNPRQPTTNFGIVPMATATQIDGLTFLRNSARHYPSPPFAETSDIWLIEAEHGRVVFEGPAGAKVLDPLGTIHGGWISTLINTTTRTKPCHLLRVRSGSFTSPGCASGLRGMSAMPLIAPELMRRGELTRCATSGLMRRSK